MAYTAKEYQGGAAATTLSADITAGATTFSAVAATGYPTGSGGNFVIVLDRGKSTEEKILCSSRTSNAFTVATSGRGYDNTTAVGHTAGAALEHVMTATDMQEANTAVVNTVGRIAALGDLLVGSGPNALSKLAVGTTGQALLVSGGTVAWGSPAPGGAAGGDLTGTYPNPTLGATGPGATGPIGSSTVIPVITIDAKGRVTALTSANAVAPSISSSSAQLAADVTIASPNTFYDGPSLSLAAGTWIVTAALTVVGAAAGATMKIWDGTTVSASVEGAVAASAPAALCATARIVLGGTTTIKASVACTATGGSAIKAAAPDNAAGNTASTITAVKVA